MQGIMKLPGFVVVLLLANAHGQENKQTQRVVDQPKARQIVYYPQNGNAGVPQQIGHFQPQFPGFLDERTLVPR